jgi:sugar lactone lactonase YvrE/serine acetyltransferase
MALFRRIVADAFELARSMRRKGNDTTNDVPTPPAKEAVRVALSQDGYKVLLTTRLRESARRWHVPGANHALRLVTTVLYGIEIGNEIELGDGVNFAHTLGTVIGGTSRVGNRVKFMGNNTVGTNKDNGCPVIEDDVVVGCGARILGPIRIGKGAFIGANAVVLTDVPAGAVATGIPARIHERQGSTAHDGGTRSTGADCGRRRPDVSSSARTPHATRRRATPTPHTAPSAVAFVSRVGVRHNEHRRTDVDSGLSLRATRSARRSLARAADARVGNPPHGVSSRVLLSKPESTAMKRYLSLLLVVPVVLHAACSSGGSGGGSSSSGTVTPGPDQPGPTSDTPDATSGPVTPGDDLKRNPIEGIAPAKVVLETGVFTDGPVWSASEGVLFFTAPLGDGGLYRMKPDGSAMKVRDGNNLTGEVPIGNTIDKAGNLVTVEAKRIVRSGVAADAGAPTVIATGFEGAEAGVSPFNTLNDAVVGAGGTIYATDPGYFSDPYANHIFRITPAGKVTVVEEFLDVPRPNGIALSPDGKLLYVSFSQPIQGTKPFIRKYNVNADGTVGEHVKFVDIDLDQGPDGIEVDRGGNLFVATKAGIAVYKSDATKIGVVPIPEAPTGMAFAGTDLKTLYVTTQGTKIFELKVNVPGIVQ